MLTNQMSSNYQGNKWYLSFGNLLFCVDFQKKETFKIFETDSLLSPIVKLNKISQGEEDQIMLVTTIDNRVYKLSGLSEN